MSAQTLKSLARPLLADLALAAGLTVLAIVPGFLWERFDTNAYGNGYKITPPWLLPIWPAYIFLGALLICGWRVRSIGRGAFRLLLLCVWMIASRMLPYTGYGWIVHSNGGEIVNPEECLSMTLAIMAAPTGAILGLVWAYWRQSEEMRRFSLRSLFVVMTALCVWLSAIVSLWKAAALIEEQIRDVSRQSSA